MKLYNINTDRVEDIKQTIVHEGTRYLLHKLTTADLNRFGYYKIHHNPNTANRRYHNSVQSSALINNTYTYTYVVSDKPLDEVKAKMFKDLEDVAEVNEVDAVLDTGLGFTVRAGRRDLDSFERGAKRNLKEVRDNKGVKHTVTVPEMAQIAEDIETQGLVLFNTKWTKFDEITALTTVDECIYYENTPYIVNEEILDEQGNGTGEFHDVTKYKNNVKEW